MLSELGSTLRRMSPIFILMAVSVPWIVMRMMGIHPDPLWAVILSGISIFTAAFLLSWAAEVAQLEMSPTLAIAILALIAVLPEYAVDMVFAWKAGQDPSYAQFAVANMTGSNRIIIGFAWAMVIVLFWWKSKKTTLNLDSTHIPSVIILLIAAIYSFALPIKGSITVYDGLILFSLFVVFIYFITRGKVEEPELEGMPATIALLPRTFRRITTALLFLFAGFVIFISAEPFAEGLIHLGKAIGIEEFLLVQWIAPLASESPEFIVAAIFALSLNVNNSLGTLISSKVNQWTLLVAFIPITYCLSAGHLQPLHLEPRQIGELYLTSAQTLLAIAIIADRRVTVFEGLLLFGLFIIQFFINSPFAREIFAGIYVLWAIIIFIRQWRQGGYLWIRALQRLLKRKAKLSELEIREDDDELVKKEAV